MRRDIESGRCLFLASDTKIACAGITTGADMIQAITRLLGNERVSVMVAGSHYHMQCINKVLNLLPMRPCVWRSPPLHSEERTGLSHLSVSHELTVFCLEAASDYALTYPYLIYYLFII